MKKKVVILPLDGYASGQELLIGLNNVLHNGGLLDLISHIKLNDAVHLGGVDFVEKIHHELLRHSLDSDLKIFLDLKIYDVSATMVNVLKKYVDIRTLDIVTVSSQCSAEGILKIRQLLPDVKLAMVSMLTDTSAAECLARFGMAPEIKIYNDLNNLRREYKKQIVTGDKDEPFDLVVCSPLELNFLKRNLPDDYGFVVPGIRDEWMKKKDEHQKRTTGVREALEKGATYVVMGAQLTKGNPEKNIDRGASCLMTCLEIRKYAADNFVGNPLSILQECDAYYCSKTNDQGKYVGPLVAYAGKYESASGPKNYVGFEYFNFAQAESKPKVLNCFARLIDHELNIKGVKGTVVLGAPMGGILLAGKLGQSLSCRTVFAEKKVTVLADPENNIKEGSEQIIDRHEINPGDKVIIVEDVCNNFSTTQKLHDLISSKGAEVVAIACAVNRSGKKDWNGIPVIAALYIEAKQFKVDDPEVAELFLVGNIVWRPKQEWPKLKKAMEY